MRQQPEEARLTMAGAQALMRTPDDATRRAMRGLPGTGVRARQPGDPRPSDLLADGPKQRQERRLAASGTQPDARTARRPRWGRAA